MDGSGWQAQLELSFVRDGERTALCKRAHRGPLRVQRPFYPEGPGICHVYVLHPPGGVVGGDQLEITIAAESGAHALVTTPAAAKLYRSAELCAQQRQVLRVAAGARLEWLPQETIAFKGARAKLSTRIELERGAHFVGWDVLCLGRPAAGERFSEGVLGYQLELEREGQLIYNERGSYAGGGALLDAPWGLGGQPVFGSMLCSDPGVGRCVERARELLATVQRPARAAVSCFDELLVARYLGPSAVQARELFSTLWIELRRELHGMSASAPRIWFT